MRIRSAIVLLLVVLPAMTGLLGGCGSAGDDVLAVVNDYEITVEEFSNFFPQGGFSFPTAQDEYDQRRAILDSVIITRLLVDAAYESGLDQSQELARVVLANKDKFLLDILYKREVAEKAIPTEAEIRDYYNHLDIKLRLNHILVTDADTAQMLFDMLAEGENFEKLAYEYSLVPSAKKDKGDLGYITWGMMVDEVQDVAFQMEVGELSPPIKSYMGYHIVQVSDRIPNEQLEDFETMKETLKQEITGLNSYRITREFFDQLKADYPITIETATCDYLLHKREEMYPPQILATLPRNDFDQEQLDRNEKELVLASWAGGQVSLIDYLTDIQTLPHYIRPDFDDYDSLATMVFFVLRDEVMAMDARKRGFDTDPELIDKLRLFKELNMADLMRNDSIAKPPEPDEGMLRQYYDDNPDEFTDPAQVHVYEILLRDEMKANQLKREIRNLPLFKDRAMELTERIGRRSNGGDMGFLTGQIFPEIFAAAWETPIGEVGGPVVDRGKYSIFWVADKVEPTLKDYLGAKRTIRDLLVQRGERAVFEVWVNERRSNTSIEINEDALWGMVDVSRYQQVPAADTALAEG